MILTLLLTWPWWMGALGLWSVLWMVALTLTGCNDPVTTGLANFATGGLYSAGQSVNNVLGGGNPLQLGNINMGAGQNAVDVGNATIGPTPTSWARTAIGTGAGLAGAFAGAPSAAGAGTTSVAEGAGGAPSFTQGLEGAASAKVGADPTFLQGMSGSGTNLVNAPGSLPPIYGDVGEFSSPLPVSPSGALGTGAGVGSGFDIRSSPPGGPSPAQDLMLPDSGGSSSSLKPEMKNAMMALQMAQTARGMIPQGQVDTPNPQASLDALQQQMEMEKQRSIMASLPRNVADASSRGLSGVNPSYFQGLNGGDMDPQTMAMVMSLLNRGNV